MDDTLHLALSFPTHQDTSQLDSTAQTYIHTGESLLKAELKVLENFLCYAVQVRASGCEVIEGRCNVSRANGVSLGWPEGKAQSQTDVLNMSVVTLVTLMYWERH